MARVHRHGEPALDKTGYFRMTQGEHEEMRSAAKVAGMSLSANVRQRLGLDAPETRACDQHRGPTTCTCGIAVTDARRLCPELDCPHR